MELKFKMSSILSPFSRLLRLHGGACRFRNFHIISPDFPDPPCVPIDPYCHRATDKCEGAREELALRLPFDKHVLDLERQRRENLLEPQCCISRIAHRDPCHGALWKPKKKKVSKPPFRSMWEPPCTTDEHKFCKDFLPRFDAIYYTPSNKHRCFQRTWVECPPVKERLKKVCCLDGIEPPEVLKRVKYYCPQTTCMFDYARMRHICDTSKFDPEGKCCKIHWPCCKPALCDNTCIRRVIPKRCRRLKTPYRCFTDVRFWRRPLRPRECHVKFSKCEAYRALNRREKFGLRTSEC